MRNAYALQISKMIIIILKGAQEIETKALNILKHAKERYTHQTNISVDNKNH